MLKRVKRATRWPSLKDRRDGEVAVEKAINALINYGILEEYQDETSGAWLLRGGSKGGQREPDA